MSPCSFFPKGELGNLGTNGVVSRLSADLLPWHSLFAEKMPGTGCLWLVKKEKSLGQRKKKIQTAVGSLMFQEKRYNHTFQRLI